MGLSVKNGPGTRSGESGSKEQHLERGLDNRHIQMIALGGTIGVGLFLVSGRAIHSTGPGLLLCYLLGGGIVFLILRALGEITLHRPVSGSFATYATQFLGPFAGFFAGWTYWFTWIVAGIAELTAIGIYIQHWFPSVPQWVTAIVVLGFLFLANLLSVRIFGECEFWFALVKVLAIVLMILLGIGVLVFGIGALSDSASFSHLWDRGGVFPNGAFQGLMALQVVIFTFYGLELVGVTAGEARDPQRTLPRAINSVMWKSIVFYVGSLMVIMTLVPWNEIDPNTSPFIMVFERVGIPAAATVVYFVVVTAALSAGNSAVFSTGRMLYSLAEMGQAPTRFARLSKGKVPVQGVAVSAALMLGGVALNYLVPERALLYISAMSCVSGICVWSLIMVTHLAYRRAVKNKVVPPSAYRLPGAPWTNLLVLAFLALVTVLMGIDPHMRLALYIAPFWAGVVGAGYYFGIHRRRQPRSNVKQLRPARTTPATKPLKQAA